MEYEWWSSDGESAGSVVGGWRVTWCAQISERGTETTSTHCSHWIHAARDTRENSRFLFQYGKYGSYFENILVPKSFPWIVLMSPPFSPRESQLFPNVGGLFWYKACPTTMYHHRIYAQCWQRWFSVSSCGVLYTWAKRVRVEKDLGVKTMAMPYNNTYRHIFFNSYFCSIALVIDLVCMGVEQSRHTEKVSHNLWR